MNRTFALKWIVRSDITVDVPDEASEADVAALVEAEHKRDPAPPLVTWEDPDEEERYTFGGWEPADLYGEPHWFDLGEYGEWCTDGLCAVRRGSPMPVCKQDKDWYTADVLEDGALRSLLIKTIGEDGPCKDAFHRRFLPLFAGAERVTSGGPLKGAIAYREGQPTAMVMPCRLPWKRAQPIWCDGSAVGDAEKHPSEVAIPTDHASQITSDSLTDASGGGSDGR